MFVLVSAKFIFSEIGPFNIHFNPSYDKIKSNILHIREINSNMNKSLQEQNKTIKTKRKKWYIFFLKKKGRKKEDIFVGTKNIFKSYFFFNYSI